MPYSIIDNMNQDLKSDIIIDAGSSTGSTDIPTLPTSTSIPQRNNMLPIAIGAAAIYFLFIKK